MNPLSAVHSFVSLPCHVDGEQSGVNFFSTKYDNGFDKIARIAIHWVG